MSNNNNYCFIKPTNSFTTPDPNGITDNSTNSGMINDGSSTSNPNAQDPNKHNINAEISIINTILSVPQSNINLNTTQVNNNTGQMLQIKNIAGDYNLFLTTGEFTIKGDTTDPLNEGFFYITFMCYRGINLLFQDDKLYRILGTNQIKKYGFNFLLQNHDQVIISITDPSSNINQTTTLFQDGVINWTGLIK